MNTNYDLRKALYNYLNVKFDANTQIAIANNSKFKAIKVEAGSIVNIFISAEKDASSDNSIYLAAFSASNVNEYYSDFLVKIYWTSDDIIYILNDDSTIQINSIYVEFLKGKLIETYFISSTDELSSPKITVIESNVERINYKDESLAFKDEYEDLLTGFNSFKNSYEEWKAKLGLYSQVDKLVPDSTVTLIGKQKRISDYINDDSINSDLLIDNSILIGKLSPSIQTSLALANSSVQNVTLNGGAGLKDSSEVVNINALTKLKLWDHNNSIYKEYNVVAGEIAVNDWNAYMQPKLLGTTGDLLYFNGTNTLSNTSKSLFLLDSDIITDGETPWTIDLWNTKWANANDTKVPSSSLVKNSLALKVDKINRTALDTVSLVKVSVSAQGLVTANTSVSQSDLTNIIQNYYLTVSYDWNPTTGVLKLL